LENRVQIYGNGFVYVNVYIQLRNSPTMRIIEYKVDSGANITTINSRTLFEMGY